MPTVRQLIEAPKQITSSKPRSRSHYGHRGVDFSVVSTAGSFGIVVRVNERICESYSMILRYQPPGSPTTILLRVNGDHGEHKNPDGSLVYGPHLHQPADDWMDAEFSADVVVSNATPLPGQCRQLTFGWQRFLELTHTEGSPAASKILGKLLGELTQGTLYDDLG